MIKVEIEIWDYDNFNNVSKISRTEKWEDTKENIFYKFYDENKSLRYCNGSYLKFSDKTILEEYNKWYKSLSESEKFHLYYSGGVID